MVSRSDDRGHPYLVPILERKHVVSHHEVWCLLWVLCRCRSSSNYIEVMFQWIHGKLKTPSVKKVCNTPNPLNIYSLARPTLNMLRTLLLSYSWPKLSNTKATLKYWTSYVIYWILNWKTEWLYGYKIVVSVVPLLTPQLTRICSSLPLSSTTGEHRATDH